MSAKRVSILAALAAAASLGAVPQMLPSPAGEARAASFDCAKAATPSDRAICANPALSALDSQLGVVYGQRVALDAGLRTLERGWIAARTAGCGGDVGCLTTLTSAQLSWLRSNSALSSALPKRPGQCAQTSLTQVGTRLGTPGSGSAVSEANGATQVSYDQIRSVDASRRGDPALVCLISLPQDCPRGDDRGKIYAVANLRTLGAWSAPDSEHMCGGA